MSCKTKCVNCKYENTEKRIAYDDKRNPEPYEGYAIWCEKLNEYIGPNRAQKEYCPHFIHY